MTRSDLFITTKLGLFDHGDPVSALKKALQELKLDYVDLFLIHAPLHMFTCKEPLHVTWPLMEECVGLTKSIGVSNFSF